MLIRIDLDGKQSHFVQINPVVGITEQDADAVITIFKNPP